MHSSCLCVAQSYVKELGQCLLQLKTRAEEQVTKRMTQLVSECQDHLNGTYEGLHPALAKAIAGGNLEQALATVAQLDYSFWRSILVSQSFLSALAFLSSCCLGICVSAVCLLVHTAICCPRLHQLVYRSFAEVVLNLHCSCTIKHLDPSNLDFVLCAVHTLVFMQDVWQLSQPQIADIMYMRRLVLTWRAVLAEERSAILSQLAMTNAQMQNNKMEDVAVLRLTEALLKVSAEHRQALCIQTQVWGHGVSSLCNT